MLTQQARPCQKQPWSLIICMHGVVSATRWRVHIIMVATGTAHAAGLPDLAMVLQPQHRGSMSGGLSAFEELAAAGNPWRRKQPARGSAAAPDRMSSAVAGAPLMPAAASAGSMPNSPLQRTAAGHFTVQQPVRRQESGQEQQSKPAAGLPGNDSSSIAAGWGSAQRIRASADLGLKGSAKPLETANSSNAGEQTGPIMAPKAGTQQQQQQQQQPTAVLTATSMQLALRLRDYCELIRSVACTCLLAMLRSSVRCACKPRLCLSTGANHTCIYSSFFIIFIIVQGAVACATCVRGTVRSLRAVPAAHSRHVLRRAGGLADCRSTTGESE
jgi:hypothetical protein